MKKSSRNIGIFYFTLAVIVTTVTFCSALNDALAGEYHNAGGRGEYDNDETLACAQCHTMHGSQGGSAVPNLMYDGGADLNEKLLRASSVMDLCLTCHEANSLGMSSPTPPDVFNNDNSVYVPSGGDYANRGVVNEPNRHSIGLDFDDISLATTGPPGHDPVAAGAGPWSDVTDFRGTTFNCIFCHAQHGNKNYRNLRYNPGVPSDDYDGSPTAVNVSYAMYDLDNLVNWANCSDGGTFANGCDVYNDEQHDTPSANRVKYDRDSVTFGRRTDGTGETYNRMSEWCSLCHTEFFGDSGSANNGGGGTSGDAVVGPGDNNAAGNAWVRHPVGDIYIGQGTNNHNDTTTLNASGIRYADDTYPSAVSADDQPFCLSCHYAHGGGNPNTGTANATSDHSNLVRIDTSNVLNLLSTHDPATGLMRNTCNACHNQ